jgi:hypothetical protein
MWYRQEIKRFSSEFRSLLSSFPERELSSIYSLVRKNKDSSVRYTSDCVYINKPALALNSGLIVKYYTRKVVMNS